jgi:hypothetical protein
MPNTDENHKNGKDVNAHFVGFCLTLFDFLNLDNVLYFQLILDFLVVFFCITKQNLHHFPTGKRNRKE